MSNISMLWKLLRPHQWVKNGFVLLGVFFGKTWQNPTLFMSGLQAMAAFCLISSCVYILNDCFDANEDRRHPVKRNRPIASGQVSTAAAVPLAVLLAAGAFAAGAAVSFSVAVILLMYLVLNVFYTLWMKKQVVMDVFCIAFGFMLRILAGTVGIGVHPSKWLLLCGMMLTLFLGFAKRRAELMSDPGKLKQSREVLNLYGTIFLDTVIAICVTSVIITYSLYTLSRETVKVHGTEDLIFTVPFVIYALFRYLYLIYHYETGEDPSRELRDMQILLAVAGWLVLTLWIFVSQTGVGYYLTCTWERCL